MNNTKERLSEIYDKVIIEHEFAHHIEERFKEFDNEAQKILVAALKQIVLDKIINAEAEKKKQFRFKTYTRHLFSKIKILTKYK